MKREQVELSETTLPKTPWFKARERFARKPITTADYRGNQTLSLRNVEKAFATRIDEIEAYERSVLRSRRVQGPSQ